MPPQEGGIALCDNHLQSYGVKKEKVPKNKHNNSSDCEAISSIFCREMKIMESIESNSKDDKIIKHIKKGIYADVELFHK